MLADNRFNNRLLELLPLLLLLLIYLLLAAATAFARDPGLSAVW